MTPDFTVALQYLEQAKKAHEKGDQKTFEAARHMILVALGGKNG
jgi:hypothetical protein